MLSLRSTKGSSATVSLPIAVCDAHRAHGRVVDAFSADGQDVMEEVLRDLGLEVSDIDWESTSVRYVSISQV